MAVVLMVQVRFTEAVTLKVEVAVAANAGAMARKSRTAADKDRTVASLRIG
jgi:hypothetical protein